MKNLTVKFITFISFTLCFVFTSTSMAKNHRKNGMMNNDDNHMNARMMNHQMMMNNMNECMNQVKGKQMNNETMQSMRDCMLKQASKNSSKKK